MRKDRRESIPKLNAKSGRGNGKLKINGGRIIGGGGPTARWKIAARNKRQAIERSERP